MPRYYGSRRSYSSRRRYRRPAYSRPRGRVPRPKSEADFAWALAKKAYTGVKYLKTLVNVERKFVTVEDSTPVASSTGAVTLINGVARGDTAETRDGASIRFTRIQLNANAHQNASATNTHVRVILFHYPENNAGARTTADILQNATDVKSMLNENNFKKIHILKDKLINFSSTGSRTAGWMWDMPIDIKSSYTIGAAGGAATDIQHGAIYLLTLSNEATNTPDVSFTSKLTFVDN